ncbi:MAG TPA: IucA/IucC family protein [Cellvibrio sp.]|nr:IucA/IucC family protein [Cellvibrio sp.]
MNKFLPESINKAACRYSALAILNCYVREIAIPHHLLEFVQNGKDFVFIKFPMCNKNVSVSVANRSAIGNLIYTSALMVVDLNADSTAEHFPWENLPLLVVEELCLRFKNDSVKQELLAQIENSAALIEQTVEHGLRMGGSSYKDYIESEAALIYGHFFHPAPKCRQGFSESEALIYGPEFGRSFQLHYFALAPETQWIVTAGEFAVQSLIQDMAQIRTQDLPKGWSLLPCHPWQAKYLLQQPVVNEAIAEESLKYLGASGVYFRPTASVRTLYSPDFPYFLKCSLSMRITNSVRKNAYYELEGAVSLTRILSPFISILSQRFPCFEFVLEPFALSANLPQADHKTQKDLRSHCGVIFRDAIPFRASPSIQHWLAATLLADDHCGESWLEKCFLAQGIAKHTPLSKNFAHEWFASYLEHLVLPLLSAYFEQGIACEPHLQNVVVKLNQGWPCGVILRDLEGTKLVEGIWNAAMVEDLSGQALTSVLHDEHKTWRRLSYCLFVNHIGQAIYQLCNFGIDENQLWQQVREVLKSYLKSNSSALVERRIGGLLGGDALISKANLITRFFQQADSDASYVLLPNPMNISVPEVMEHA